MASPGETTLEEWRALYQAADDYRRLAPWEYMADTDLFAIDAVPDGRTGYCSVFGGAGQIFGLAVFLGPRGYRQFTLQAASGEEDFSQIDPTLLLERLPYAVMLTFEDAGDLDPRDEELLRALGLAYQGGKAWPMFRLHEPGFAPWFLDRDDVLFLTLVLREAQDVVRRVKSDPGLLAPPDPLRPIFTRRDEEGHLVDVWADEPEPEPLVLPLLNLEELAQRVHYQKPQRTAATWEVDYFYLPSLIQTAPDSRPEFPHVGLWVDAGSGLALDTLAADAATFYLDVPMRIFETMLRRGVPRRLHVRRLDALATLAPIAQATGAKIRLVDKLEALDYFKQDLVEHLSAMPEELD